MAYFLVSSEFIVIRHAKDTHMGDGDVTIGCVCASRSGRVCFQLGAVGAAPPSPPIVTVAESSGPLLSSEVER